MVVASDDFASEAPLVLVCDDDSARAGRIAELIARSGVQTARFRLQSVDLVRARVAVVAVAEHSRLQQSARDALRHAGSAGIKTLAYAHGASVWSTADQCQILLLGASILLDTGSLDFECALQRELNGLLQDSAGVAQERAEVLAHMADAGFVSQSEHIHQVFRLVIRLSMLSDVPVLIEGESGTGKELIAKALHRFDARRKDGPFVAVNCAAISPALAESEFFGHTRGAFTGAERQRKGVLRAADGGVLFLDEIGELSQDLQAKMLRVLQEGEVTSVGDEKAIPINVRVIAATNRNLSSMVREGRFRSDLYHRLSVVPVRIPPLRERLEDIDPLVRHFVEKHRRLQRAPCTLGADFGDALRHLPLPGNARELENLVRQALLAKRNSAPLGLRDLPYEVWQEICLRACAEGAQKDSSRGASAGDSMEQILSSHSWKLSDSLEHCERQMIDAALVRTNGNRTKAARLLGITPRSMYNKLRRPAP